MLASLTRRELAARMDHALLAPNVLPREFEAGVREARQERTASVCVRPCELRRCAELLAGSGHTAASTVIAFPFGYANRAVKVFEAREALEDAASVLPSSGPPCELDLVVNVGRVLAGQWDTVRDELTAVCNVTHTAGALLKVIFETGYLNEGQIRRLCELCGEIGVDFVKTSTGFGPRGASVEDVRIMRESAPPEVRIKASGGIRTLEDALRLIEAGADRLGTSRTRELLDACES